MKELDESSKIAQAISYESTEARVVFKIGWYVVSSRPGVILDDYNETPCDSFTGMALFSTKLNDTPLQIRVGVADATRTAELAVWAHERTVGEPILSELVEKMQTSLSKYNTLSEDNQQRVKRALLAKMCWDRVIYSILKKTSKGEIYFHLAHGREMLITATTGEEFPPLLLSTSAWLQRLEKLPNDAQIPADDAAELAKKSLEWKRDTRAIIARYL